MELSFDPDASLLKVLRGPNDEIGEKYFTDTDVRLEPRAEHDLMVFEDEYSVELFVDGGAVCITMLTL